MEDCIELADHYKARPGTVIWHLTQKGDMEACQVRLIVSLPWSLSPREQAILPCEGNTLLDPRQCYGDRNQALGQLKAQLLENQRRGHSELSRIQDQLVLVDAQIVMGDPS